MGLHKETLGRKRNPENAGQVFRPRRRLDGHTQNHQIGVEGYLPPKGRVPGNQFQLGADAPNSRLVLLVIPHKDHASPSRFGVERLPEAVGDHIAVENHDLALRIEHFDANGVLHRVGAADPAAVFRPIGNPHALDEDHLAQICDTLRAKDDGLLQFHRGDDPRIAPVHKDLAAPLLAPGSNDGDRVSDLRLHHLPVRADGAEDGAEVPHPPCVGDQFGASKDVDPLVADHAVDQIAQQPLGVLPLGDVVDVAQVPAQFRLPLHQGHVVPRIGDGKGSGHTGDAATDDQSALHGLKRQFTDRLGHPHAGHRHPHQFLRLPCGPWRIVHVAPGTMLTDVDHLQQVGIQPRLPYHLLEQRLVRPMTTRSHHHPVEALLSDSLSNRSLPLLETAVLHRLDVDHIGEAAGELSHRVHVHRPVQRGGTATQKDPHPRRLPAHISFGGQMVRLPEEGILPAGGVLPQVLPQQPHRIASRTRSIQDRLGDLLRRLERPTDVNTGSTGLQRRELVRLTESIGVQLDPQHLRQVLRPIGRPRPDGEHHQVEPLLPHLPVLIGIAKDQIVRLRILLDPGDPAPSVLHLIPLSGLLVIGVELFVEGPLIHHKDLAVNPRDALFSDHRLFGGIHTAD